MAAKEMGKESDMNESSTTLSGVVGEHIDAVNAYDEEAIVATFAADALVNDARREFWGSDAIREWVAREMVGDHVSIEVTEAIDHHGQTILPDELILTNYFTVRNGKIDTLIVIRNEPV
jgi:ketosteroid isomerase-like protein